MEQAGAARAVHKRTSGTCGAPSAVPRPLQLPSLLLIDALHAVCTMPWALQLIAVACGSLQVAGPDCLHPGAAPQADGIYHAAGEAGAMLLARQEVHKAATGWDVGGVQRQMHPPCSLTFTCSTTLQLLDWLLPPFPAGPAAGAGRCPRAARRSAPAGGGCGAGPQLGVRLHSVLTDPRLGFYSPLHDLPPST